MNANHVSTTTTTESLSTDVASLMSAAFSPFRRIAQQVTASIPGNLIDADDVATDALLRAIDSDHGVETLTHLVRGSHIGRQRATVLVRSVAIDTARRIGMSRRHNDADIDAIAVNRWATAVESGGNGAMRGRSTAESELVAAALAADSDVRRSDRDLGRTFDRMRVDNGERSSGGYKTSTLPKVHESTTDHAVKGSRKQGHKPGYKTGSVQIVRTRPLEDLLTDEIRIHHETPDPSVSGDYDATLTSPISERLDREYFSAQFAAILSDYVASSPNAILRKVDVILARMTPAAIASWTRRYRDIADNADRAVDAAQGDLDALRSHPAPTRESVAHATRIVRSAQTKADRAHAVWSLAHQATLLRAERPIFLADLVMYSVSVSERHDIGERSDTSTWDRAAVLTVLGMPIAGNAARALSHAVECAAQSALDATATR